MIEQVFPYSVLTNTGSICVFFFFICTTESTLPEEKFRDVLFEVIVENEVLHRFDTTSHKFWERYSARNAALKKKLGYFSIENIDDLCMTIIAVNLKEYIETFKYEYVNKKHKGLRKGALEM